ncbi:hypothetical protein ACP70R_044662 [Stipagrostis hirtigluma subsp. patula]
MALESCGTTALMVLETEGNWRASLEHLETALASPVGKKVAAIVADVDLYSVIAEELLINGIKLLT